MPNLSDWAAIPASIRQMEEALRLDRDLLRTLNDAVGERKIQPEVTRRQAGKHSDPTSTRAIQMIERRDNIAERVKVLEIDIQEKQHDMLVIESAVRQLPPRDAEMVRRFYLQRERWESIAVSMHLSRSRFYELLDRARGKVETLLQADKETATH